MTRDDYQAQKSEDDKQDQACRKAEREDRICKAAWETAFLLKLQPEKYGIQLKFPFI